MAPRRAAQFYEPGGLSVAGDMLYVADTNNHAIRTVNVENGEVGTLALAASQTIWRRRTKACNRATWPNDPDGAAKGRALRTKFCARK